MKSPYHPWTIIDAIEQRCGACGLIKIANVVKIPGSPKGKKTNQTYWITPEGQVLRGGISPICVKKKDDSD